MSSNEPDSNDNPKGVVEGALSSVSDTLGDLVTGIPAPIRRNATKAFARLCTAAVEYPVTLIEGAIAEKRAESRARVKLIDASAKQIAKQMQTDPEYVRAAAAKFAHKIVRERVNIDQISEIAASELKSESPAEAPMQAPEAPHISEDWLNAFENQAAQMSSEQRGRDSETSIILDKDNQTDGRARQSSSIAVRAFVFPVHLDAHCSIEPRHRRPRSLNGQRSSELIGKIWSGIRSAEHVAIVRTDHSRL